MGFRDRIGRAGPSEPPSSEPDDLPIIELDTDRAPASPPARAPARRQRGRLAVIVAVLAVAGASIAIAAGRSHHVHSRTEATVVLPPARGTTPAPVGTLDPDAEFVSRAGLVPPHGAWALNKLALSLTSDGVDWRTITPPGFGNPVDHTSALAFVDARHAWAATDVPAPTIWRTSDGGVSWQPARVTVCGQACGPVVSLDFLDARRGWATVVNGGAGTLADTDDGGATWHGIAPTPVLGPAQFVDARHGWMTSSDQAGAIFRTRDGGRTWSFVTPADAHAATVTDPAFFGAGTVVVAVVDLQLQLTVWQSTNGGVSWRATDTPVAVTDTDRRKPSDLRFVATSPSQWIVLDGQDLYLTADSGAHWRLRRPTHTLLREVAFVTPDEGWILADAPGCGGEFTPCGDQYLYRTLDEGRTWALRSPRAGVTANRLP